jgi:RNA polymerase sigma-70 factor (ECF subfamily)
VQDSSAVVAEPDDLTSLHVRRAIDGDGSSLGWLVERLSPALHMQARYRLRGPVSTWCDPADLVQDVWAIALPRLPDLVVRDGRMTPVLVRFLSTTLLHRVNRLIEDYLRGDRPRRDSSSVGGGTGQGLDPAARSRDGVSACVGRAELQATVREAIEALSDDDRHVVVLRGIEQMSNNKVAEILGCQPSAATMRYQKALQRLRQKLPGSVFAELPGD